MTVCHQQQPVILWYRADLRVSDHSALTAAAAAGSVIPLYIFDDVTDNRWAPGPARQWWLEGSLQALESDLQALGSRLILRRGQTIVSLVDLVDATGATTVFYTRRYEPHHVAEEKTIAIVLAARGVAFQGAGGTLLHEPATVTTGDSAPYRHFTKFARACQDRHPLGDPLPAPVSLTPPRDWPASEKLSDWRLRQVAPERVAGLGQHWLPGAGGAAARLEEFLRDGLTDTPAEKAQSDRVGSSMLSPHLSHGEIGPRQIWTRVQVVAGAATRTGDKAGGCFRKLLSREFACHQFYHRPELLESGFNPVLPSAPWRTDANGLAAWQQGRTGYPIVDAGMRELLQTGWISHDMRVTVAMFLIRHLLIAPEQGARWFWDTLVDADLANNSANWHWMVRSAIAAKFLPPDPVKRGRRIDPSGYYIRKWVPELADLPAEWLHAAGSDRGRPDGYPAPVVEHGFARRRAYAAINRMPGSGQTRLPPTMRTAPS